MTHPALAHKYDIVQFTRGNGVEVGGGQLYPHFKKAEEANGASNLDFVFLPEQITGAWPELVKVGGHVVQIWKGEQSIMRKLADGSLAQVNRSIPAMPGRPKTVCVVRYGGFGDMIQASGIFPALQRDGYTVYVMSHPAGEEILRNDPFVDGWLLQDKDQVPNHELPEYWEAQAKRFDKFVNLSESVEGTLLAYPGRTNHQWPASVRRRELNKNYLEWTAQLAEVPFEAAARHHASIAEKAWATRWLIDFKNESMGRALRPMEHVPARFNIMWVLAGSSVHKMYPHQDDVIQAILSRHPDATVTLVGDQLCELLEQGWETNPRVRCTSGKLNIRETLALAQQMDCVVGPETGVLNAVGLEPMGKVVMLSHSSAENLTKHWLNTTAVHTTTTPCYPCHQLHNDRRYCPEHQPTGAALCAQQLPPAMVIDAIEQHYGYWRELRLRTQQYRLDIAGYEAKAKMEAGVA